MKLYHGSTIDISEIDLLKSKPNKDFGKGFYLSADKQQAYEMASYKAAQLDLSPIVNTYEFDERALTNETFRVKQFDDYSEEMGEIRIRQPQ